MTLRYAGLDSSSILASTIEQAAIKIILIVLYSACIAQYLYSLLDSVTSSYSRPSSPEPNHSLSQSPSPNSSPPNPSPKSSTSTCSKEASTQPPKKRKPLKQFNKLFCVYICPSKIRLYNICSRNVLCIICCMLCSIFTGSHFVD